LADAAYDTNSTNPSPKTAPKQNPDLLLRLKRMYDDARTLTMDARTQSMLDRDYYDGHQLTPAEIQILRFRGQPELIINRVRRGVDGIIGVLEQGKTDPRAYMRNPPPPGDPSQNQQPQQQGAAPGPQGAPQKPPLDAGDVASMTLRFIADTNQFKSQKMDVLENGLVEGNGASIIEQVDGDVTVTQIRWEEFFYDPHSRRADFGDARYMGVAKWMYADVLAAVYPEQKEAILNSVASTPSIGIGPFDATWEDRPLESTPTAWIDRKQRRLVAVDMYYQEATAWNRCVFSPAGIHSSGESSYQDDKGAPRNPIVAWSAYVDRNNARYGVVRDMRGPQDEINMRRSKLLHLLNVRQVQQVDPNAPTVHADIAREEAAKPDGVIPTGWNIVSTKEQMVGQAELLAEAKAEIERMGPNPAILGRQGADASGRSVQMRQQAGLTELARVIGRFSDWELRVYRAMWNTARQFWTDPKWIRVTDDLGAPKFVRINDPSGPAQIQQDPQTGQPTIVPQMKNHIAKMDVDIIVDTVPDTANLQQEIFTELTQLAQAYGPQAVPFKVLLQMSPLPRKQELINMLEEAQAEVAQQQQGVMQGKMAELQAQINKINSEVARNMANAGLAEVQTAATALQAHVTAHAGAQLPPGYVLDQSGKPQPIIPPQPQPGAAPNGAQQP